MKLLSLIIPTYNMAVLLPRCLDSLLAARLADYLDILVVNDGSRDRSSEVAHRYEAQHPDIVRVIDKPNGNYGSTINAALPLAAGTYVKILDSDDFFDTPALDQFLICLQHIHADIVLTHFTQRGANGQYEVIRYNTLGREPYTYGRTYALDEVLADGHIRFFLMHALAYRTELLRAIGYRQTEGISYTDTEWASIPIFHAATILFLNLNLYQYNLDREGQTMAPEVVLRSIAQLVTVTDHMLDYYRAHRAELSPARAAFMKQYFENRIRILYKLYLLDMPRKSFQPADLQQLDDRLTAVCAELDLHPRLYPENKLLRIDYIAFWHRHHRRWSPALEALNRALDRVMKWLYVRIFRR